jgi:hypothetical protein
MPSDDRPAFARDFPRHPALDALVDAFARGNYARVRAEATRLAESERDQDVRRAALELIARTAADPLSLWLLVLAGALLVALSTYWIVHGKPPPGSTTPASPTEHAR